MDVPRMSKSVRRITVFEHDKSTGVFKPVVVFQKPGKGKKGKMMFRPFERTVRMVADGADATASTYLKRHKKANRKRRDGWVRDLSLNMSRAGRKGVKEFNIGRMLNF